MGRVADPPSSGPEPTLRYRWADVRSLGRSSPAAEEAPSIVACVGSRAARQSPSPISAAPPDQGGETALRVGAAMVSPRRGAPASRGSWTLPYRANAATGEPSEPPRARWETHAADRRTAVRLETRLPRRAAFQVRVRELSGPREVPEHALGLGPEGKGAIRCGDHDHRRRPIRGWSTSLHRGPVQRFPPSGSRKVPGRRCLQYHGHWVRSSRRGGRRHTSNSDHSEPRPADSPPGSTQVRTGGGWDGSSQGSL